MSASRRRQLGQQLKQLRLEAGFERMDDAVAVSGVSRATISRGERGEQRLGERTIRALCHAYGVGAPDVDHLVKLAKEANEPGWHVAYAGTAASWFERYLSEEAEAHAIYTWAPDVVPGPFQLDDYARDLIMASNPGEVLDQQIANAVELRKARLSHLLGDKPAYHAVLSEAAIRYQVSGPDTMRHQLERLIELSQQTNITIQVLPFSAGAHPGNNGSFTILEFEDAEPTEPTLYCEVYGGAVYPSGPASVGYLTWMHERLRSQALSPEATRELLRRVVAEY